MDDDDIDIISKFSLEQHCKLLDDIYVHMRYRLSMNLLLI